MRLMHGLLAPSSGRLSMERARGRAGHGVPAAGHAAPLGARERALRAQRRGRAGRGARGKGGARRSRPGATSRIGRRACFPAASSSASRWRAPGRCTPRCCSWTSPPPASIPTATREIEAVIRAFDARRNQDRDGDPQPRPGAAPGRRGDLPSPGPRRRARPGREILRAAGHRRRRRRSSKENCHGLDPRLLAASPSRCSACRSMRNSVTSPSRRPRRPSSRACSSTCCRSSRRRPASRCAWWRSAPARRSTWAGAATPTWCSCTPGRSRRNSSPRATACAATR